MRFSERDKIPTQDGVCNPVLMLSSVLKLVQNTDLTVVVIPAKAGIQNVSTNAGSPLSRG